MLANISFIRTVLMFLCIFAFQEGCGSGAGDNSDLVLEGRVVQGDKVASSHRVKHASGAPLEKLNVCAIERCSTTDSNGLFGFSIPRNFSGESIQVSVRGHGIDATFVINYPKGVEVLNLGLESDSSKDVHIEEIFADGEQLSSF